MKTWLVYKIQRSDGLLYIGKTNTERLKKECMIIVNQKDSTVLIFPTK